MTVTAAAPGVPTGLTLDVTTATQIVASWTAPANNGGSTITGYYVEYRPGTSGSFANMTVTTTTATITSLAAGAYQVKVAAINAIGTGLSTTPISATVKAVATVPNAPTSLTLTGGVGEFTARWIAPVNDGGASITGYTLDYRLGVSGNWTSANVTALTTTITGLTAGSYQVRVAAINSVGTGGHSGTHLATVTAVLTVPGVPRNFTLVWNAAPTETFQADWTAPASDGGSPITRYEYHRDYSRNIAHNAADNFPNNIAPVSLGLVTRWTSRFKYLQPAFYLWVRVRAVNAIGNGPYTATLRAYRP